MASGPRPGGLTALSVLNFVFGGFNGLFFIASVFTVLNLDKIAAMMEEQKVPLDERPPEWLYFYALLMHAALAFLLITSGVGYLRRRKKLGRRLGNSYALVSILDTVVQVVFNKGGFSLFSIVFIVYPLLTLVALNTIFKDDFE